jgi:hypothetical protein
MRILITPDNGFVHISGSAPEEGKTYLLEDATNGSLAQSRAWHALLQEYWRSGQHSYNAANFGEFRDMIKRDLGAGFEAYVYADNSGMHKVKHLDDVPANVPQSHIMWKLKSWSKYTKKERANAIDSLVAEMHQAGVTSKKFDEILTGLEG